MKGNSSDVDLKKCHMRGSSCGVGSSSAFEDTRVAFSYVRDFTSLWGLVY